MIYDLDDLDDLYDLYDLDDLYDLSVRPVTISTAPVPRRAMLLSQGMFHVSFSPVKTC